MTCIDEKQQQHMVQDSHTKCCEAAALTNYAKANGIRTFDSDIVISKCSRF